MHSNVYYNLQLPAAYPVYYYPQYPPVYYTPAAALPPRSPPRARYPTPPPPLDIHLHKLLSRSTDLEWLIVNDPIDGPAQYLAPGSGSLTKIPQCMLSQKATDPPISTMELVFDEFRWSISVSVPGHITVEHVLSAIYNTLQEPISRNEWDDLRSNGKKNAHTARCTRMGRATPVFAIGEESSAIRKVDLVGDKLIFLGLKPRGPRDNPEAWVVRLGVWRR